jgi:hypothetical protein
MVEELKRCSACKRELPVSCFYFRQSRQQYRSRCNDCHNAATRSPAKYKERYKRHYQEKRKEILAKKAQQYAKAKAEREAQQKLLDLVASGAKPSIQLLQALPRTKEGNQLFLDALMNLASFSADHQKLIQSELLKRSSIYEELVRLLIQHDTTHIIIAKTSHHNHGD